MSIIKQYIKETILTALLFSLLLLNGYSQGTDIRSEEGKHLFVGLNLNPAQTSFSFSNTNDSISGMTSTKKNSFSAGLEIGYQFSKYFGLSSGIGFNSYPADLSLSSYSNSYKTTDSEGDSYRRIITGNNIKENQKLTFLSVPVKGTFQIPFGENFGFYLQAGVSILFSLNHEYNSQGTMSYSGYYSIYDITISGVPWENFLTNQKADVTGDLIVKSLIPELTTSTGFNYTIKDKFKISLGVLYCKMLSNISDYTVSPAFQLSSNPNQVESLMEGSGDVTSKSVGLRFAIQYYFK